MGLSGLEPPTSRLSGVRSNRLSYRPIGHGFFRLISHCYFKYSFLKEHTLNCTFKNGQNILIYLIWIFCRFEYTNLRFVHSKINSTQSWSTTRNFDWILRLNRFSLERRWSSRTFRYGYLVTTSPQSSTPPSTAASLRLAHRLRVLSTLMVWRAVCTRPGNVFTATFWFAITSNSTFMQASCSLQSELRPSFVIRSTSRFCCTLLSAIVVRV